MRALGSSLGILLTLATGILCGEAALAQTRPAPAEGRAGAGFPPVQRVTKTSAPIRIDGDLNDEGWRGALVLELPFEIMPGENLPAPVRTDCRIAYDDGNVYFGFHAFDPKPEDIRARITDRDSQQADDGIGVFIDTFNDERRAFEFFSNPLGVQSDVSRSDVADGEGDPEDPTWDAIWNTAGRLIEDGYVVEIAIPLTSLRFPRTQEVQTWGLLLFRNYPRDVRHQIASAPYDRNRNCSVCQYTKITGFEGIAPGRNLEFDPTMTMHRSDRQLAPPASSLAKGPVKGDVGVSIRWGLRPNLSVNGAVNPDFSQVEADAAQLNVNTRYALFYDEKRPFFLEGADLFATTFNAVYTRTVADPLWGLKLSGKEGRHAIGSFVTRDERLNLLFPSNEGSYGVSLDRDVTGTVLRYRRDVGSSSTLGFLGTDREAGDYHNRLIGADGHIRLGPTETIQLQILGSSTRYPRETAEQNGQPGGAFDDLAGGLGYEHGSRNWNWSLSYSDLGRDFRADAGFIPRVDMREAHAEIERTFWPKEGRWFNQIVAGLEATRVEDHDGTLTDLDLEVSGNLQGRMQSYLMPVLEWKRERFVSRARLADSTCANPYRLYDQNWYLLRYGARPAAHFNFWGVVAYGDAIDYENGRAAKKHWGGPGFSFDLGRHFQFMVDHTYEALKLEENGKRLYLANLVQSRAVYQFNVRTFVRALVHFTDVSFQREQYTFEVPPGSHEWFSQLLFSYKINPQTVFYLGYSETRSGAQGDEIRLSDRTFFTKIGYAWLI